MNAATKRARRRTELRFIVRHIEAHTRLIAEHLRHRRREFRKAKDLGIEPEVMAALIRERRAGKDKTAMHRRKLAQLRRIVR